MNIIDIRNNHLSFLIEEILKSEGDTIPVDLADLLIGELSLATLICPVREGKIELLRLGPHTFVPAFTDLDSFLEYDRDVEPKSWEFVRYFEFMESDVDGVIINPKGFGFVVDLELILAVFERYVCFTDFSKLKSEFTSQELNRLRETKNPKLEKLLVPNCNLDELYEELSKTVLFTFMGSYSNAEKYAVDGIIPMDKLEIEGLTIMKEFGMECGLVFTSFEYLEPAYSFLRENQGRIIYPHPINIELMAKFIIELDLDALIINYPQKNVVIPREYLLESMEYIAELCSENVEGVYYDYVYLMDYSSKFKGYDVKVRLDDFRPLTWRDLIIPAGITFKDLDDILKILWDFGGYHLSRFTFKDSPDIVTNEFEGIDFEPGELNSKDVIIDEYFEKNKKIYWEYDYGDGWSFTIEVKKAVEYDKEYPVIKRFKGEYNPQDDIGGVGGMKEMMEGNPDMLTVFDQDDIQENLVNYKNYFIQ